MPHGVGARPLWRGELRGWGGRRGWGLGARVRGAGTCGQRWSAGIAGTGRKEADGIVVARADEGLDRAKAEGRNRTESVAYAKAQTAIAA